MRKAISKILTLRNKKGVGGHKLIGGVSWLLYNDINIKHVKKIFDKCKAEKVKHFMISDNADKMVYIILGTMEHNCPINIYTTKCL